MQASLKGAINQVPPAQDTAKSGVVPSFQQVNENMSRKLNAGNQTEAQKEYGGNIAKVQEKPSKNEEGKPKQHDKVKQIHNQLNQSAETYSKMYDIIKKEKEKAAAQVKMIAGRNQQPDYEDEDEDEETEEDLFDYNVLSKLRFQQISERKQWQGVNVTYSGIPGTSSLIPNEGIMMFVEERGEMDAQAKIFEVFKEIHEVIQGSLHYCQARAHGGHKNSHGSRSYFMNDSEQHGQFKNKGSSEVRPGASTNQSSKSNIAEN